MSKRRLIPIAVSLALSAATVYAADAWHLLGSTSVTVTAPDAAPQRDEIRLLSARGSFTNIRLEVDGATVALERLVITFAHGSTKLIDLHKTLKSGESSAAIELKGGTDHVIRKVDFWYNSPKFATVRLYAR